MEIFGGLALDEERSGLLASAQDGGFPKKVRSDEVS